MPAGEYIRWAEFLQIKDHREDRRFALLFDLITNIVSPPNAKAPDSYKMFPSLVKLQEILNPIDVLRDDEGEPVDQDGLTPAARFLADLDGADFKR